MLHNPILQKSTSNVDIDIYCARAHARGGTLQRLHRNQFGVTLDKVFLEPQVKLEDVLRLQTCLQEPIGTLELV